MKKIYLLFLVALSTPESSFSQFYCQFGYTFADGYFAEYNDVEHDSQGNILIVGKTQSPFDFDPSGDSIILPNVNHIYVGKFTPLGNIIWGFEIPTYAPISSHQQITCDEHDNVIIGGLMGSTADFDPGPSQFLLSGNWLGSGYLAKYDKDGNFIWAKQITASKWPNPTRIVCDNDCNIYTTGGFKGSLRPDTLDPNCPTLTSQVKTIYICKYDSSGHVLWARNIEGETNSFASPGGIALLPNGSIAVSTVVSGSFDLDPSVDTAFVTSLGYAILYFDGSGNYLSHVYLAGNSNIILPGDLAVDHEGSLIAVGSFNGTVDLDPGSGTCTPPTSPNSSIAFCMKLYWSGALAWGFTLESSSDNQIITLDIDDENNVWLVGSTNHPTDFDPNSGTFMLNTDTTNDEDGFIAEYTAQGQLVRAFSLDYSTTYNSDEVSGVSCFNSQVVCSGRTDGVLDFDPSAGTNLSTNSGRCFLFAAYENISSVSPLYSEDIMVYPNPTFDLIHINGLPANEKSEICLYDPVGTCVFRHTVSSNSIEISTRDFAPGVYSLTVSTETNTRVNRVVVSR